MSHIDTLPKLHKVCLTPQLCIYLQVQMQQDASRSFRDLNTYYNVAQHKLSVKDVTSANVASRR